MFWIVFGAYSCYHPLHPTSLGSAPWTVLTFGEFVKDFETRNNGKLRNGNEGFADLLLFHAGFGLRCVQKCVKHTLLLHAQVSWSAAVCSLSSPGEWQKWSDFHSCTYKKTCWSHKKTRHLLICIQPIRFPVLPSQWLSLLCPLDPTR